MSDQSPLLADVILAAMETRLGSVFTAMPGKVTYVNHHQQCVNVQPSINIPYTAQDGDVHQSQPPEIFDVPLIFNGSSNARLTTHVASGDYVLLVFSCVDVGLWKKIGIAIPESNRKHHIADAFAIPGLFGKFAIPQDSWADNFDTVLHSLSTIRLGSNVASQSAILGDTYRGAEDTLFTALRTFITAQATYNAAVATAVGASLTTAASIVSAAAAAAEFAINTFEADAADYLSSRVKLE